MDTAIFFFFTLAYAVLLIWGIWSANRNRWLKKTNMLLLVILGLIYDNGLLAVGRFIGEGSMLEVLNYLRYWFHALLTPLLALFSWDALQRANVRWSGKKSVAFFAWGFTVLLMAIEFWFGVYGLELVPEWQYGVLSYTRAVPSGGPPVMVLLLSAALLFVSIIIWIKEKWPWLFIGTLLMIIGSSISFPIESEAITNAFELILITSLFATKFYQDRRYGK